jgi:hypothetical protein
VAFWLVLPIAAISFGTSKLYHYAYPFLPPAALAAGYVIALVLLVGPAPAGRLMEAVQTWTSTRLPGAADTLRRPGVRAVLLTISGLAMAVAVVTVIVGPIRLDLAGIPFKSSGVFRPLVVGVLFGLLGGATRGTSQLALWPLMIALLPLPAYRASLTEIQSGVHPMRAARECVEEVAAQVGGPGLYVNVPRAAMSHPMYYHFRRVQPWLRTEEPAPDALGPYMTDPAQVRPVLVWEATYRAYRDHLDPLSPEARMTSPPMVVFPDAINGSSLLLLPGPYAVCAERAEAQRRVR